MTFEPRSGAIILSLAPLLLQSPPQSVEASNRVTPVTTTGCSALLKTPRLVTDEGIDELRLEVANTAQEDLQQLQLLLLVYGRTGNLIASDTIDADPAAFPIPPGKTATLKLIPPYMSDSDLLRIGVSTAFPAPGCRAEAVRQAAATEFEPPDLVVVRPDGLPFTISDSQVLRDLNGLPNQVQYQLSTSRGHFEGEVVKIEAFLFDYRDNEHIVLRIRADQPHRGPFSGVAAIAQRIPLSAPALLTQASRWKVVLEITEATVDQHAWKASKPIDVALKALRAARPVSAARAPE